MSGSQLYQQIVSDEKLPIFVTGTVSFMCGIVFVNAVAVLDVVFGVLVVIGGRVIGGYVDGGGFDWFYFYEVLDVPFEFFSDDIFPWNCLLAQNTFLPPPPHPMPPPHPPPLILFPLLLLILLRFLRGGSQRWGSKGRCQ